MKTNAIMWGFSGIQVVQSHVLSYTIRKLNFMPTIFVCSVVSLLSFCFPSLFTLLVSCTGSDIVILGPVESNLAMTVQYKTFKHCRGYLEDPFTSIPPLVSSYSAIETTAHPLCLQGTSFLGIESSVQQFFHKRRKKGLWNNHSYRALLLS